MTVASRAAHGKRLSRIVLFVGSLAVAGVAHAQSPDTPAAAPGRAAPLVAFESAEQRALYETLLEEYRCLKCQNQNLADSNAALAGDLRREVYERVVAGVPRSAIDSYLIERYGEFVLYRPRFRATTWLLWIGPFLLLGIAGLYAMRLARRSRSEVRVEADRIDEARALLRDER